MSSKQEVFRALRSILRPYAEQLDCKIDNDEEMYVDTKHLLQNKKPLWFGAVQVKKNYVSYHLMPVYLNPRLLDHMSPDLNPDPAHRVREPALSPCEARSRL